EFANSFSNRPDSWKSSLGFYLTARTYFGRNGLSLKIEGLDSGFNDLAGKRNIVLHGCSYVGVRYKTHYGNEGTSLGCPAVPNSMSPRIIRAVKNGSCFFIYHPTQQYLNGSSVLNSSI
ncbi:MAG: murein L,D-transpeptidase catalytic domain family protein, partial [Bacteroidota bacterium]|nr:murein L,D-transpeptidase catalytic domain family protein [Bacteroidota bacterium]